MKAVIDRFESNYAVVLFGDKGKKVDIPRQLLKLTPPTKRRQEFIMKMITLKDYTVTTTLYLLQTKVNLLIPGPLHFSAIL